MTPLACRRCPAEASRLPSIGVHAGAKLHRFELAYPVCVACAQKLKARDLISPASWARIAAQFLAAGLPAPDGGAATVRWYRLEPGSAAYRAVAGALQAVH